MTGQGRLAARRCCCGTRPATPRPSARSLAACTAGLHSRRHTSTRGVETTPMHSALQCCFCIQRHCARCTKPCGMCRRIRTRGLSHQTRRVGHHAPGSSSRDARLACSGTWGGGSWSTREIPSSSCRSYLRVRAQRGERALHGRGTGEGRCDLVSSGRGPARIEKSTRTRVINNVVLREGHHMLAALRSIFDPQHSGAESVLCLLSMAPMKKTSGRGRRAPHTRCVRWCARAQRRVYARVDGVRARLTLARARRPRPRHPARSCRC